MHGPLETNIIYSYKGLIADLHHESINTYRIKKFLRTQRNDKKHCGHNGTVDITGRTRRFVMSAHGYNGTMKIHRGHNGTTDITGRTTPLFRIRLPPVIKFETDASVSVSAT